MLRIRCIALLCLIFHGCATSLRSATGSDNPGLPGVSSVLTKAEDVVSNFTAQAAAMQKSIEKKQRDASERLAIKKQAYEAQLAAQEEERNATRAATAALKEKWASLRKRNEITKQEAEDLRQSNRMMRESLSALEARIHAASDFVTDSLVRTDDHESLTLKVLEPPTPEPTLKYFLSVAGDGPGTRKGDVALLQQDGRAPAGEDDTAQASGPAAFVAELSRTLEDWTSAEQEGEERLEATFKAAYEAGRAKQTKLLEKHDAMNSTVLAEEALMDKLDAAKHELQKTRAELKERLHGIEVFGERVSKTAREAQEVGDASVKASEGKVEVSNDALQKKVANETKIDAALNLASKGASAHSNGNWLWR